MKGKHPAAEEPLSRKEKQPAAERKFPAPDAAAGRPGADAEGNPGGREKEEPAQPVRPGDRPVSGVRGIGPKKEALLEKLGIRTVEDLLHFYPREYQDRSRITEIGEIDREQTVLVRAMVRLLTKTGPAGRRGQTVRAMAEDATGTMEVLFFRASYMMNTLRQGAFYDFYGKAVFKNGRVQMLHPEVLAAPGPAPGGGREAGETGRDGPDAGTGSEKGGRSGKGTAEGQGLLPVYPLTAGLTQKDLRNCQREAAALAAGMPESLPARIREEYRLCGLSGALENIHFPRSLQKWKEAKYRLVFEELLLLQTGLFQMRDKNRNGKKGISMKGDAGGSGGEQWIQELPFTPTRAQRRTIGEVFADMEEENPMNRLVQGDVGSGKTVVAEMAIRKAAAAGCQSAFMAPTELLARQHYDSLRERLSSQGIRTGYLGSAMKAGEKKEVLEGLQNGGLDLVIGTHAIIQPSVAFSRLGLVITDEQHRFGVRQRAFLTEKGTNPHVLVMTATPIPRTLAMIMYGDLDISVIDQMPPGRIPIVTRAAWDRAGREAAYRLMEQELDKGHQAYVVAPLIEDSETAPVRSAESLFEELSRRYPHRRIRLLHGEKSQGEKTKIMEAFYRGDVQVLVSTVVIEVGINVPEATVMIIENAERFGLAQLHQLRGRVGRGSWASYCILINEGKGDVARERARIMTESADGFVIAEEDLRLRGPGEFFGTRQHGLPALRIADLARHGAVLRQVRTAAQDLLREDPALEKPENAYIKEKLNRMFQLENGMSASL